MQYCAWKHYISCNSVMIMTIGDTILILYILYSSAIVHSLCELNAFQCEEGCSCCWLLWVTVFWWWPVWWVTRRDKCSISPAVYEGGLFERIVEEGELSRVRRGCLAENVCYAGGVVMTRYWNHNTVYSDTERWLKWRLIYLMMTELCGSVQYAVTSDPVMMRTLISS
jgi:hypothetical protein